LRKDPNCKIGTDELDYLFALLESLPMKTDCKTLVKSTPGVKITNILFESFSYESYLYRLMVNLATVVKTHKKFEKFGSHLNISNALS